jgi:hypothetical protein
MEPKEVVASLALHTVLEPIFTEMEREETMLASVQTLRDAFTKAERSHPGLAEEFLSGVLQAEGAGVNLPEALLQLACRDVDHYTIPSDEKEYVLLNERARGERWSSLSSISFYPLTSLPLSSLPLFSLSHCLITLLS